MKNTLKLLTLLTLSTAILFPSLSEACTLPPKAYGEAMVKAAFKKLESSTFPNRILVDHDEMIVVIESTANDICVAQGYKITEEMCKFKAIPEPGLRRCLNLVE